MTYYEASDAVRALTKVGVTASLVESDDCMTDDDISFSPTEGLQVERRARGLAFIPCLYELDADGLVSAVTHGRPLACPVAAYRAIATLG